MKSFLIAVAYAALAGAAFAFLAKTWFLFGIMLLSFPVGWIGPGANTRPAPQLSSAGRMGMIWTVVYLCAHLIWHIW